MQRVFTLVLAAALAAACSEPVTDNAILVGEYNAMSGPQATFGQSAHAGIVMAIEEVNASGGVDGRELRLITEDDQSRPELAVNAVSKLISQDGVVALLGEVASSTSLAAAPIAQRYKVPMITSSSTNPAVTRVGDFIFRMSFIDPYQGQSIADYIARDLGLRRAALLVDVKSDYSTGLASFFESAYQANGGAIVARHSYTEGDNDFRPQLTAIRSADPDVIFVPGYYNDVSQIAIQARDLGLSQPLAGGDGWESPKLIELGGKALEGSFYSNSYFAGDPDPRVREFVERYQQRYGETPDALAALGYDAATLLADAMKRSPSIDGPAIRDALAATKAFPGVTGDITYGPDRDPVGKKLVIVEIRDGALTLKDTVDP
ncbi:MAG TPA: ABC transporter substrate-binding protein [Thermoanaerobaculia bacterium]|nr:ABC transporter substrate-binding protein [Thermoanaerobaculia bacterium]